MTLSKDILAKFSDYPVFKYRDVKLHFKNRKNLSRILSYLRSIGRIYKVGKGIYSTRKDSMVSGFAYAPFYYGLLSALTIRELWTQNSRPDIMTIKKVRRSKIAIFDEKDNLIFLHHIPAKYFFGFDMMKYGDVTVPVSNPEKTLIDLFYYNVRLSIQNYSSLLKTINMAKLRGYLKKYDSHTATTVMNFVKKYRTDAIAGKLESPY